MITITKNAARDNLTEQDYLDMLSELLQTYTLRQLAEVLNSDYSFGAWAKYKTGERPLPRDAKNELRVALKLPPLPPTVQEAIAEADENSEVVKIGQHTPDLVYMTNRAELVARISGEAVAHVTSKTNAPRNERVFDMSRDVLGWKIANREVMA